MFNETYADYIRNVLGYSGYNDMNSNMYMNNYQNNMDMNYAMQDTNYINTAKNQLEQYYPEIYKVIYPMIKKACEGNMMDITPEMLDGMTNEIYMAIESDNMLSVNITLDNQTSSNQNTNSENRNVQSKNSNIHNRAYNQVNRNGVKVENRSNNRSVAQNRIRRNKGLEDLIRILLIREYKDRPKYYYDKPYRYPYHRPYYNRPPYRPMYNRNELYE